MLFDEAAAAAPGRDAARDRQPPGPLHRGAGRGRRGGSVARWSPSTRSSTGGSSAACRPATCSARNVERGRAVRRGAARRGVLHQGPARLVRGLRPPLHRRQARLLDPRRRPALARHLPAGAGAGPRRLLLDRRDPRHPRQVLPAATCATCGGRTRWRSSTKAGRAAPTGCGSSPSCRGGCATSSSRCCCGCGCGRSPGCSATTRRYDPY